MKLFSIIIPHFNNWDLLYKLLETIPADKDFEIIVIDDKSDHFKENNIIMTEKYPNVILKSNTSKKKGAGAARNIGLAVARGKWLLFADSDDLFTLNFESIVRSYEKSESDIIYFKPDSFSDSTGMQSVRHIQLEEYLLNFINEKNLLNKLNLKFKFLVPWSKMIKRNIVENNLIKFEEIMVANDVLFSAKVGFYSDNIEASTETIYCVRQREGSLTSVIGEENFKKRFAAWLQYVEFLKIKMEKKEFDLLNLSSMTQILNVRKNKLGFKYYLYIIKKSRSVGIPIIDKRLFNVSFTLKSFFKHTKNMKKLDETSISEKLEK